MTKMNIGEVARASGLPAKTIRYYEDIGLIRPFRQENGYRVFDSRHLNKLRFLQRARSLGFSVDECRSLLALYEDEQRTSAEVKKIARQRLADIEKKMAELTSMRAVLVHLMKHCHGDNRPQCPILDSLSGDKQPH